MRLFWRAKSPEIDIDLTSPTIHADPYPTYARLRRERPLALVPTRAAGCGVFAWTPRADIMRG